MLRRRRSERGANAVGGAAGMSLDVLDALYALLPPGTRIRLKSLVGAIFFRSGLYRLLWRNRAVIILFHRVDDQLEGDSLTCTEPEFRKYCRFFRRYFHVVSLGTLLDRLAAGQDISRSVAITFDDGYKDNRSVAAPVLKAHGLPATFFVTSSFVGSEIVPWWDAERSITPTWMTWDDLRWLADNGFEIGAHTVTHPDLGEISGDAARTEIVRGGAELASQIGSNVTLFSFPYGRAENLLEDNRQLVRAAGYRCCLAAVGGVVRSTSDPYRLDRYPISPPIHSVYHLGFNVLLQLTRAGAKNGAALAPGHSTSV